MQPLENLSAGDVVVSTQGGVPDRLGRASDPRYNQASLAWRRLPDARRGECFRRRAAASRPLLSSGNKVAFEGVIMPAVALINGPSAAQVKRKV
jgi:hypothetical protein